MRDLISHAGTDYFAFAVTAILALTVTLAYLWWSERAVNTLSFPGLAPSDKKLGNLGEITKFGGLHEFLTTNHKKFGSIFSFYWCKELAVSINSSELFKDVQTLFDRPENQFILFRPLIGEGSIQYLNTPLGQRHRKLQDRHFGHAAIKSYFNVFTDVSKELLPKWSKYAKDEHIPLRQHMLSIAAKSMIRSSFGPDYFKTNKELLSFIRDYDTCWEEMELRLDGDFPKADSEREQAFNEASQRMRDEILKIIHHRRGLKEKHKSNLLDVMLESKDLYLTDEQLCDMVITYLIGGFHTTGNLLTWLFYFVCNDERVEKTLLKEIETVVGDGEINMELVGKLTYTRQVIDETLRCSALAPYAARFSEYDIVVGGHIIPKHTPIIIAIGASLWNEKVFPEPKRFDPERFSLENVTGRALEACAGTKIMSTPAPCPHISAHAQPTPAMKKCGRPQMPTFSKLLPMPSPRPQSHAHGHYCPHGSVHKGPQCPHVTT